MPAFSMLWAAVVPAVPIIFGGGNLIMALASVALALCTLGFWLERERPGTVDPVIACPPNAVDRHLPVAA